MSEIKTNRKIVVIDMKKAVMAILLAVLLVCVVFSSCVKKEDGAVTGNDGMTHSAAQNAVTNAGDAVGDAVTGAGDIAGDVVTGAADIAGDVITGAGDIVNDAVTGAGDAASKAVSDVAR